MTIDKKQIITWALVDIGHGPVFSIDDDSDLAGQIVNCWQRTVDRCFGLTDWHFARRTYKCTRHAATPENGWRYGFDLPGNRIGPALALMPRAGHSPEPLRNFDLEASSVYCNEENLWARVKVEVDPDAWDPPFREAFVVALGGYLAVPVWQDEGLRETRLKEAFGTPSQGGSGGIFGRILSQDKASAPIGQPLGNADPMTQARHSSVSPTDNWFGRF